MILKKEECACFTGHRVLKKDLDVLALDVEIIKLLERGYKNFLCGMAMGFDMLCFKRLLKLKNKYPDTKIIACVPCKDQPKKFPAEIKKEYFYLLEEADEIVYITETYTDTCMKERDRFMVDNSSVCISYIYKSVGGAYYTTKYALENEKEVIFVK